MDYVWMGRTGVRVSQLAFGTMSFGGEADEATASAMFARCRDAGVNHFDCADVYNAGRAEEIPRRPPPPTATRRRRAPTTPPASRSSARVGVTPRVERSAGRDRMSA